MKKTSKIICTLLIIISVLGIYTNVFASEIKTNLEIIQKSSIIKDLGNDQGNIVKSIVDSNLTNGEVTVELKVKNFKKEEQEKEVYENTEIYLMVSENIALEEDKLTKNINNIEKLVSHIFKTNSKTKIGIIGIKGTISDGEVDKESGNIIWGEKDEGNVNGSASNAEIVVNLTNNVDTIKNGLRKMNSSKVEYYPNLQAAIRLANKSYSSETNKILISLYDGVPDIAIGVCAQVSTGIFSIYSTTEEAVKAKHENIATYTKNEIMTLKSSNVQFILLRPDDTSYDETWYSVSTGEKTLDFDGSPYVQMLYGTIDKPTYGKMYSFTDENIEKIVTENIYQDVKNLLQPDMNKVKIIDYFPKEIVDNFNFSYVGKPNIGTVTENIDTNENSITWDIGTLKGNEDATLRYKLKIKDMKNTELLNKTIPTNDKIVLKYTDTDDKEYKVTLKSSPKIRLTQIIEKLQATVTYDPTDTTNGKVTATIQTNKPVKKVKGWTLSEDGMTLTKEYSKNTTEKVHLEDMDGMTKDINIKINNIKIKNVENNIENNVENNIEEINTKKKPSSLPYTGVIGGISAIILLVVVSGGIAYIKYRKLRGI